MLHEALGQYLDAVESALCQIEHVHVERYEEEILASDRVNLRIRVRFATGHLLELNEAVIVDGESLKHLDYRYHFQDDQNRLVFRYDCTPHFPELPTFPHHKHLPGNVIAAGKPSILDVVEEAKQSLE